jgi:uncharacterized GH25 family protein
LVSSATTAADGTWSTTIVEASYDVWVLPPEGSGFARQFLPASTTGTGTQLDIVLIATSAMVRYSARVVDEAGLPVAGIGVLLRAGDDVQSGGTDANGEAVIEAAAGDWAVSLWSYDEAVSGLPDQLVWTRSEALRLMEDTAETLVLELRTIRGVVVDATGNPVANATVTASVERAPVFAWFRSRSLDTVVTDADGRFALRALVGPTLVSATPNVPWASPTTIALTTHDPSDIELEIVVPIPQTVVFSAVIQDRDGTALPGLNVCMWDCVMSDVNGAVSFETLTGDTALVVYRGSRDEELPQIPDVITARYPFTLTADTFETVTLANRFVRGTVVDEGGRPIAGVQVFGTTHNEDGESFTYSQDQTTTDENGRYVLALLRGEGTVHAVPSPDHDSVETDFIPVTVVDDLELEIVAPRGYTYTARLRDRDGAPLPAIEVCMIADPARSNACRPTDAHGDAVFRLPARAYVRRVYLGGQREETPQLPDWFSLHSTVTVTGDAVETVVVPNRVFEGVVLDGDGNPVAHAWIAARGTRGEDPFPEGWSSSTTTDANGRFRLSTLGWADAPVTVWISPDPATGLEFVSLEREAITDDVSVTLLVQLYSDSVAADVSAGGTLTTDTEGDGATAADPVETSVTSPIAGTVEIRESPITRLPPSGSTFLAQQVTITAPLATATEPLFIELALDASRVPAGENEETLAVFRDGAFVAPCTATSGATPDPCIASRTRVGDDVVVTARSSRGGTWNVGVRRIGDGDSDGLLDDVDACPADAEDADGFQDEDGCPDLDDDGDGVLDAADACREEPEDLDGFEDTDGCPEPGPTPERCPDFDGDGVVTVRDQVRVARAMGSSVGGARYDSAVDLDADGDVDVDDLRRVLARRGATCPLSP